VGVFSVLINRLNLLRILLSVELMLLGININFVAFSHHLGDLSGQVFSLFILTIAAAEAAIGLAILVLHYRRTHSLSIDHISSLKG
jgi:NADH-quinone oxidoreductase subunit K